MQRPFEDILDECLDRHLLQGESVEACVASYPEHAVELRGALELAATVRGAYAFQPEASRKRVSRLRFLQAVDRRQQRRTREGVGLLGRLAHGARRWAVATTAVVMLLTLGGSGTVLAAEDSLPGDLLYPVKRAAENTRLFFTFTDAQEARVRSALLDRRVKELEAVTEKGRTRFVPELATQVERHARQVRTLAVAPVDRLVASVEATPTPRPVQGTVTPATPSRERPVAERPKTTVVRANRLLQIHAQLDRTERTLQKVSELASDPATQRRIQQSQEQVRANLLRVRETLARADAAHRRLERPTPEPSETSPRDERPTPTVAPTLLVRVKIVAVEVVRTDGRVRVDLTVVTANGRSRVIHLSPQNAQLERGSLRDLQIGTTVQLAVNRTTGEVRLVRILQVPSETQP